MIEKFLKSEFTNVYSKFLCAAFKKALITSNSYVTQSSNSYVTQFKFRIPFSEENVIRTAARFSIMQAMLSSGRI